MTMTAALSTSEISRAVPGAWPGNEYLMEL